MTKVPMLSTASGALGTTDHSRYLRSCQSCQLHGEATDASRGSRDQHPLAKQRAAKAQSAQGS